MFDANWTNDIKISEIVALEKKPLKLPKPKINFSLVRGSLDGYSASSIRIKRTERVEVPIIPSSRQENDENSIRLLPENILDYFKAIRDGDHELKFDGPNQNVFFKDERPFIICEDILSDYRKWSNKSPWDYLSSGVFYNYIANAFPEARDRKWIKSKTHRGYFLDRIIPELDKVSTTQVQIETKTKDDCTEGIVTDLSKVNLNKERVELRTQNNVVVGCFRVKHVTASSIMKGHWRMYWERCTKIKFDRCFCSISRCPRPASVGAHVYIEGDESERYCYIIPMCSQHNKDRSFNYKDDDCENWIKTKQRCIGARTPLHKAFYSTVREYSDSE